MEYRAGWEQSTPAPGGRWVWRHWMQRGSQTHNQYLEDELVLILEASIQQWGGGVLGGLLWQQLWPQIQPLTRDPRVRQESVGFWW